MALPALLLAGSAAAFDADTDGLSDEADAFPCNSASASVVFAPAQGQHGMMLFEDQWPSNGDLDFNDAALAYNYIFELDASGRVLSIRANYNLLAVGGIFNNGLGLHIPVAKTQVASVKETVLGQTPISLTPQAQDPELTLQITPNLRTLFGNQAGPINSDPSLATQTGVPVEIEIRFSTPVTLNTGLAPFDVYLFRTETPSHEIHRPEFAGTGAMDQSLFHSADDNSTVSRHFVDRDGMPFALVLPSLVPWSREGVSIEHLYPNITSFAASGGTQSQDFYINGVDLDYAYGWTVPSTPPRQGGSYSVADWQSPVSPAFVGPESIPADTGCVNAWGLSVQFGTQRDTYGYGSVMDSAGNIIITGYTRRSLSNFTNAGAEDLFVAKYNRTNGALVWARQLGGTLSDTGRAIAVDASNNIYVVGETRSTFDGVANAGQSDAFLTKYDASGTKQWTRLLGGSGSDYATGVAVDAAGNVFIAGGSNSTNLPGAASPGAGPSSFLAKYDANGTRLWNTQYRTDSAGTGNYNYSSAVSVDPSGNALVVGSERRFNRNASSSESPFVAKHNGSTGALIWTQHLGDFGYYTTASDFRLGHSLGVTTDSTGAVYVAGEWEAGSTNTSWGDWTRLAGDSSADLTLTKLDAGGTPQWSRSVGSTDRQADYGLSLRTDASQNLYLVGYTRGTLAGQTARGGYDYLAARYDAAGNRSWLVQNGSNADDGAFGLGLDTAANTLYVVGNTGNVVGVPVAFQNSFYGFIAQHNLGTGAQTFYSPTVDVKNIGTSCQSILSSGLSVGNGVYTLDTDGSGPRAPFDAYCDMTTDGGGWTLLLRYEFDAFFTTSNWPSINKGYPADRAYKLYSALDERLAFASGGWYTMRYVVGDQRSIPADFYTGYSHKTVWRQGHDAFSQQTNGSDYVFMAGEQSTTCSGFNGLHAWGVTSWCMSTDVDSTDSTSCWWQQVAPTQHYYSHDRNYYGYLEGFGGPNVDFWQTLWYR